MANSDLLSAQTMLSMSNRIFMFENGELEDHEVVELFQDLIETKDRKSTRLNSSHVSESRMPSSA